MKRSPTRVIEDWWFYKGHGVRSGLQFAVMVAVAVPLAMLVLYGLSCI